jgi:O-antigen ligase
MLELLSLMALVAAWLVPNHYPPWGSFYNEAAAGAAVFLFALDAGRSWLRDRLPAVFWFVCAVALIPPLQWLFGRLVYAGDAWVAAFYVMAFASAIGAGYLRAGGKPGFVEVLSTLLLAGAAVSSFFALAQALEFNMDLWANEIPPQLRPSANLGQPNNLATLIGMALIGLWLLYEVRRLGGWSCAALLVLLLTAMALTQSRTALAFGPVVLVGMLLMRRRIKFRTPLPAVAVVAACQFLLMWIWPQVQSALLLTSTNPLGARALTSNRFIVWPKLVEALNQSPWTGYGWLQVGEAQLAMAGPGVQFNELWLHGHNLFLELLLWCGYPLGGLLGLCIVIWAVSRTFSVRSLPGAAGVLTLGVAGAHSMIELPYHYLYLLVPVGLWIGIIERAVPGHRSFPARWGAAVVAAAAALGVALAWNYHEVEEDFRLFRFEKTRVGSLRAAQPAPDAPLLSSLTAFLRLSRLPLTPGLSDAELAELAQMMRRYPYPASISRYAAALALRDRADEGRQVFLLIRSIYGEKMVKNQRQVLREQGELEHQPKLLEFEATLPD